MSALITLSLAVVSAAAAPRGVELPISGPDIGQRLPYRLNVELVTQERRLSISSTLR